MLALAGSVSSPQSGGWVLGISGAAVAFVTLSLILTQLALLSIAVMAEAELGESSLRLLRGLGRRNPWLMAFLAFGLASAVGLPATLGFAGVLQAIRSALEASHVLAVGLALVAMPVALAAALRVLRVTLYETIPEPDMSEPLVTSSGLTIVCAAFAGAVVWLGVCPAGLVDFTQQLQLLAG
jgi:NADH:ubiquinone oxidoreductase subunit 2 (subunit N)